MKPLLILAALLLLPWHSVAAKPNIILIYTDDHGWPDVGVAGIYDDLKTPHLDALAKSGVYATSGYSTAPQCVPSRAGVLSGSSQNRFGVESNGFDLAGFNEQLTIAERLKEAGYATGQIGKWHLGPTNQITDHGFDDVYAKNSNRPCFANYTLDGASIDMQQVDDGLYHLDACSDAAVTFIKRHENSPFFLYLAYRAPHVPLDAPNKYLSRFPGEMPERRRQALAMIAAMDDGVGKIVTELKERDLYENTLIFFIGDNGAPLKIHKEDAPGGGPGWDGSLNEPMNGEKGMLAEGGMRVPFLISFPGTIPGGQVYEHPVWALDVAATATELAGLPKAPELDGVNLIPYLNGEETESPDRSLTWRWLAQSAIRDGKWKLLRGGDREYLFDLEADPSETNNLLSSFPEIAERLREELTNWSTELDPPGLAVPGNSTAWMNYFDFYLDGQEPAPIDASPVRKKTSGADNKTDWIVRRASAEKSDHGLVVTPLDDESKTPFLVVPRRAFRSPVAFSLQLSNESDGKLGISWREEHQKDFPTNQAVLINASAAPNGQSIELRVPIKHETEHFRLFLPPGVSTLQQITLSSGGDTEVWNFTQSEQ